MQKFALCLIVLLIIIVANTSNASLSNSSFEDPGILSDWDVSGIVSQAPSGTVFFSSYTYDITATEGNNMALLSAPSENGGGYFTDNRISQTVDDFQGGILSFDYNIFSMDWYGNDRFTVHIDAADDDLDYYWEIDEVNGAQEAIIEYALYSSNWQHFSYDLGMYAGYLTVTLSSGNGIDDNWNTWTYLDNFIIASADPVPVPATIVLLATGLIGIAGMKKKCKNSIS